MVVSSNKLSSEYLESINFLFYTFLNNDKKIGNHVGQTRIYYKIKFLEINIHKITNRRAMLII